MDVSGVEAFLISIQRQAEVSSSGAKPTGLMRFSLSVSNTFLMFSPMIKKFSVFCDLTSKKANAIVFTRLNAVVNAAGGSKIANKVRPRTNTAPNQNNVAFIPVYAKKLGTTW